MRTKIRLLARRRNLSCSRGSWPSRFILRNDDVPRKSFEDRARRRRGGAYPPAVTNVSRVSRISVNFRDVGAGERTNERVRARAFVLGAPPPGASLFSFWIPIYGSRAWFRQKNFRKLRYSARELYYNTRIVAESRLSVVPLST